MSWALLQNSLLLGLGATLVSIAFGIVMAVGMMCLPGRWRKCGLALCVMTLAMPPFVVVNCWIDLLGQTGKWRSWLSLDIYTLGGAAWVMGMMFWPLTAIMAVGALSRLDREMIDAAAGGSAGSFLCDVLIPVVRPVLGLAAGITLVLALNQFSIPAVLQVKVHAAEVWLRFNTAFDHIGALTVSWPLVIGPLALLWGVRGRHWYWPWRMAAETHDAVQRQLGMTLCRCIWLGCGMILFLTLWLPLWRLTSEARTWTELGGALAAGSEALSNSITFAAITASMVCALGLVLGRWRQGGWLWLFFLVPGVLTGIGWVLLLNGPHTAWFYQSAGVVVLAMGLRFLAIGHGGARVAVQCMDRDLLESARLEGVHGWALFRQVYWPQLAGPVSATWFAVYVLCLWEVESVVLLLPPGCETLSMRIFNLLHYGHNAQVNALCVALMALALAPLVVAGLWAQVSRRGEHPMTNCQ